jgi:hypothetical protein
MSADPGGERPETDLNRFRDRVSGLHVNLGELLVGIALIPVGVVLEKVQGPDTWWLGSAAYMAWLLAAILIVYQVHHLVSRAFRRIWSRIEFWIDFAGLPALIVLTLGCPAFLASAPGRAAALVEEGHGQALAAPLWSGFFGTVIGLFLLAPTHRDRAFSKLSSLGWLGPVLISVCFLTCAVTLFTSITLYSDLKFDGVSDTNQLSAIQVAAFYLWHFLDLMPLKDLPETLRWDAPLTYTGTDVGRLVVVFQLCTASVIVATFRAYWTTRHPKPSLQKKKTRKK